MLIKNRNEAQAQSDIPDYAKNHSTYQMLLKRDGGISIFYELFRVKTILLVCLFVVGSLSAEIYYPWKGVYVGALDAKAWSGLVFVPQKDCHFAFRIRVRKEQEISDSADLFYHVSEVGPHSPEGAYCRLRYDLSLPFAKERNTPILKKPSDESDTLTLEWSRQDENTVIGRVVAPKKMEIQFVHYFPWKGNGKYSLLDDAEVRGESALPDSFKYLLWISPKATHYSQSEDTRLTLSFSTEKTRTIYFVAGIGEDEGKVRSHTYRYKRAKIIKSILEEKARKYRKQRVKVEGLYEGVARAVANNIFWMTLYQPEYHRLYTPDGRNRIFPQSNAGAGDATIFPWTSFFTAIEASVESEKHAQDIIHSVLRTQYPNGCIPHWRSTSGGTPGRSQPPIGSYVVLKFFQKTGNLEILKTAYPYLVQWHSFWKAPQSNGYPRRDGNRDGLLEWGDDTKSVSSRGREIWESGKENLPNWDDATFNRRAGTLNMNCIDLNALYTLDAWCLAQMARILELQEDSEAYLAEYREMKELVNTKLWNEKDGFYYDRYWNGRFSKTKAASNFLPLLARIPEKERALRMLRHLLNGAEFWGKYVVPTVSRDDPSFQDQYKWRGRIWPSTNYLVYQGLKAYRLDTAAGELAAKSAQLFLRSWENFQLCPENYDARTGEAGGQRFQSTGPLLALMALEEYLDINPWEGFRFGLLTPEKKGKLLHMAIQGRHYDISVSPSEIKLKEEGKEILKTNGGAVFRRLLYSENEVSFEVITLKKREIGIHFLLKGKYQVLVDNQVKKIFKGDSVKIQVPEGEHSVLILLLEKTEK